MVSSRCLRAVPGQKRRLPVPAGKFSRQLPRVSHRPVDASARSPPCRRGAPGQARRVKHPGRVPGQSGLLATEASQVADADLDQASELLFPQVDQLGDGDPVIVVAPILSLPPTSCSAQNAQICMAPLGRIENAL